jgi:hypothetical protein
LQAGAPFANDAARSQAEFRGWFICMKTSAGNRGIQSEPGIDSVIEKCTASFVRLHEQQKMYGSKAQTELAGRVTCLGAASGKECE